MSTRFAAVAASITCALALAACSSSSNGGGNSATGGSNTSTGSSASSKSPIKLMVMGPVNAPQFSLPGLPIGAVQAAANLNKAGGINGHKVQIITCNDKNDPNTGTQCVREAITDKVAALVGGFSLFDSKLAPLLQRAGIPWVGGINANDFTSSNLFYSSSDAGAGWVGLSQAMAAQGCKKMAIVTSAQATTAPTIGMKAGAKASGVTIAGVFPAPANSADWAPTASAVKSSGADCVAAGLGPTESPGFITAIRSAAPSIKLGFVSGGLPVQLIAQLKDAANGITVIDGYYPWSSTLGDIPSLKKQLLAADPKASLDTFALAGYAATKIVADAAKNISGDVTAGSLLQALPKVSKFDTGVGPVVSFTTPNPAKGFSRVFVPQVFVLKVVNGSLDLASKTPLDATAGLKLVNP